jgi:serine/threonine protein kinase
MDEIPDKYAGVTPLDPGQNADVYVATNRFLNREVFLKVYDLDPADPTSALREPQILTQLHHENLAKIYSAEALAHGRLLLEMEFISGGSLQAMLMRAINTGIWPSVHQVLDLARDIASGLSHLHNAGYVHRDGKPANIMVRRVNGRLRAVVTDLGLAARIGANGRAFGSKHARLYRPPEVWDGAGYSRASDVYQLGIIIFQLLGGELRYAFGNAPDSALAAYTKARMLFKTSALGPHVLRPLANLIQECLCGEADRIRDMPSLIVAIQKNQADHPDWRLRRTSLGFRLGRRVGRKDLMVDVRVDNQNHEIQRLKKSDGGTWRKSGRAIHLKHSDLRKCREFQQMLSEDW